MKTAILSLLVMLLSTSFVSANDSVCGKDCDCGCNETGICNCLSIKAEVKKDVYDPYGISDYTKFREWIVKGIGEGILTVGPVDKNVGSYQTHCRVDSGWKGLADGEYTCFALNGDAVMVPKKGIRLATTESDNAALRLSPTTGTCANGTCGTSQSYTRFGIFGRRR